MRNLSAIIKFFLSVIPLIAVSCLKEDIIVNDVSLDRQTLILKVGESTVLNAEVTPLDASNKSLVWTSSDTGVAVVFQGKVTAKKAGKSTIIVSTECGGHTATCDLEVKDNVSGIRVDESLELYEFQQAVLKADILTAEGEFSNESIIWECPEDSLLTVFAGTVFAKKAPDDGHAVIVSATTKDRKYKAECRVTIKCHVFHIEMNKPYLRLEEGTVESLSYKIFPKRASDKTVSWSSTDSNVATVSPDGLVTAIGAGAASIIVTSRDGKKTDVCEVEVVCSDIGLSIFRDGSRIGDAINLEMGEKTTLVAKLNSDDASALHVKWSSNDESVAVISQEGVLTTIAAGLCVISATTGDGRYTATCLVTVNEPQPTIVRVTGVELNKKQYSMTVGSRYTLTTTINPSNATDKSVTWKSSNPDVVSVSDGMIEAKSDGEATVIVTTTDGGYTDECRITVTAVHDIDVTGVELPSTKQITVGKSEIITAKVFPADATDKTLTWFSDNPEICSVNQNGMITGKSEGSAKISATSNNGKTGECTVHVSRSEVVHVTRVLVSPSNLDLYPGQDTVLTVRVDPENATNKDLIWEVNGGGVIVSNGRLTATKAGSSYTIVTVSSVDNPSCKNSCIINTIALKAEGMTLDRTAISLKTGDKARLEPVFKPVNTTDKTVTWTTDNKNVVTVADGVITAQRKGTAIVTATSRDGGFTAVCRVTVSTEGTGEDNKNENVGFGDLN